MAGNTSKNEVAAKMIGAQLQSLLKIPPIKKVAEAEQVAKTGPAESRGFAGKETGSRYNEEKENSRNLPTVDHNVKGPASKSSTEPEVIRDRFGRPFQSLDRRGRSRDYHNAPPKRLGNTTRERDAPVHAPIDPPRAPPVEPVSHPAQNQVGKGRQHPRPEQLRHNNNTSDLPGSTISKNTSTLSSSFEDRASFKPFSSYEQPPRFAAGEESRVKGRDLVDPAVRLLARKVDCPLDIKEKLDHFHDNDNKSWPNETASDTLRRHFIIYLHRKNPKFPRARYYCTCCNYHLDNLSATLNHILQERHYCLEKMGTITSTLATIPPPSAEHASFLTDLLIKTSKLHGMNHTERMQRLDIGRRLCEVIKENNLDCQAAMFGSSLSGFGFRDSNVNININVGSETSSPESEQPTSPRTPGGMANNAEFAGITTKLIGIIKQLPYVSEHKVREVYTPKCVSIHFEEEKSRTSCIVHFNNNSAVLAAQLFAEYDQLDPRVKPLVLCFRHWARICDLDDQEKGFLPAHCFTIMAIHFLQARIYPVLPILHLIPKVATDRPFATAEEAKRHWTTKSNETIGELWLELFKYYALDFDWKGRIVSISRYTPAISKDEKQWNRKLCIEDPILPKSNLSRSVTNNKICDYIIDRIKLAYQYFGVPRQESGPLYEGIISEAIPEEIERVTIHNTKPTTSQALQRMVRQIQKVNKSPDPSDFTNDELPENVVRMVKVYWRQYARKHVLIEDVKKLHDVLFKKEYHYEFKLDNFTDGTLPPIICKSCGAEGHLKTNCPEETVPPYLPVEYPTPLTLSRLNKAIAVNFERDALDSRDVAIRTRIVDEVRAILLPVFPNIHLVLFGSTFNGFGMHSSDVDICLTFNDVDIPPGERGIRMIDVNDVLEKVVNSLKTSGRMTEILSIPSAKVPIVKFRHVATKLEGDISLYNRLSIYNTELLRSYVDLDSRVAQLGLFLKKLVKLCDVGDASKGSLSSYSYILMLIHFLQNHSVPVLPVIQELDLPRMENFYCDNHLIRYHTDVDLIARVWEGYGRNKESVSQLWLAFLNYYVEKFDHEKYVITISQSAPLARASKCWYTEALTIEDPFDKSHNLGSGLTRRMSVHILKTFQKCRLFFHRSTDHLRNDVNCLEYYLDARQVRDGNPPIDRQCRLCYRIGHYARNCTYANKREEEEISPAAQSKILSLAQEDEETLINGGIQQRVTDRLPPNFVAKQESPVKLSAKPIAPPTSQTPHLPASQVTPASQFSSASKAPQAPLNKNPWPTETVKRELSPEQLHNGSRDTPLNNVIRRPDVIAPPKPKADTSLISHSLNALLARSRELEEVAKLEADAAANNKPVKEVVFFGDIGSPTSDGEQIQAMLKKNEGVTFTFDLSHQQQVEGSGTATTEDVEHNPVINNGMIISQPPPGFCPPGGQNMYMGAINGPIGPGIPFIPEQTPSRPVIPTPPVQPFSITPIGMPIQPPPQQQQQPPIAYGHNPQAGMPLPFPSTLPVGGVAPFDNRPPHPHLVNGENVERPSAPPQIGATTAPPPGFAPLPTASTSVLPQPTEMLRSYPASPYPGVAATLAPTVTMFSMAPVGGIGFQHLPNSVNHTSVASTVIVSSESGETTVSYRPIEAVPAPIGPMNLIHPQHMGHILPSYQHHMIPMNPGIPNGQQLENGGSASDSPLGYPKVTTIPAEVPAIPYNMDYGGPVIPGGNTPVSSYGLSLSQAHHGPVVSALQMQHSLMQGGHGHFHHHIRPIMAIGNYHHGSAYAMHPPIISSQTHGIENNMIPMNADATVMNQQDPVEIKQVK